jgi:hypothetical protein
MDEPPQRGSWNIMCSSLNNAAMKNSFTTKTKTAYATRIDPQTAHA